jgi:site-specific DNA-methyltransferase (adenine-specific)
MLGHVNHDSSKFYNSKLYKKTEGNKTVIENNSNFPYVLENKFILGTAENMCEIPNNSVYLMITSSLTRKYTQCLFENCYNLLKVIALS